jgi:hypothetical protein
VIGYPNCDKLIENKECVKFVEIHMKLLKLWSAVLHTFFRSTSEQVLRSLQVADHFAIHCKHLLPCPSLNILHHCLTVRSLIIIWS